MSPNIQSISRNKQISKNKRMFVQVIMTVRKHDHACSECPLLQVFKNAVAMSPKIFGDCKYAL